MATSSLKNLKVGFIGSGMMCEAIIRGMVSKKGSFPAANIWCSDRNQPRRDLMKSIGCNATNKTEDVCYQSDVVILAVKPKDIIGVLSQYETMLKNKIIISIAAGITLGQIKKTVINNDVIRVMPNTPMLVGASATCYAHNILDSARAEKADQVINTIFGPSGLLYKVPESKLDAVTGVSGSGPAYVYMMIEAMSDAGVQLGLPRNQSNRLAAQTVMGAAKMCLENEDTHAAQLRNRVESPGGTTIAATTTLEHSGFRSAVINAVNAAANKSKELGGM